MPGVKAFSAVSGVAMKSFSLSAAEDRPARQIRRQNKGPSSLMVRFLWRGELRATSAGGSTPGHFMVHGGSLLLQPLPQQSHHGGQQQLGDLPMAARVGMALVRGPGAQVGPGRARLRPVGEV